MTTEEITTSVDAELGSIEEQIAQLRETQAELTKTANAEREAKQLEAFNDVVDAHEVGDQDWDKLAEIGIVGFIVSRKVDADGGPDVTSVEPVLKRTSAPKATSKASSGGSGQRDLAGTFEAHATDEERAALEAVAGDNNKSYALRLKVWNRVNEA